MVSLEIQTDQLIDYLYTAIMVIDRQLYIKNINTAAENMLSVSLQKAVGHKLEEFLNDPDQLTEIICRSFETNYPFTERGLKLLPSNNTPIIIDCMVTPLVSKTDRETSNEVIVEMIDANSFTRVMREESASILHDAARESLRGMAHEIKNPLGGLRGAAQLLQRELNGNDLTEYTNIIISEADRLGNLIDRMMTPDRSTNLKPENIHEVLEYVQNLVEADAGNDLKIERDYDPSLPDLEIDREQLIQAFLNILRNAVQATAEKGHIWINTRIKRKCTIRQQLHKLGVQIEIADDGPGVPPDIENGIFYPMVTGRAEGTGLGLSISQSIIQAHGGIIEHERCNNRTIFRILLPIRSRDDWK